GGSDVQRAILGCLQGRGPEIGDIFGARHDAVLAVSGEDAADQQRVQAEYRHLFLPGVAYALDGSATCAHGEKRGFLQSVPELETAADEVDAGTLAAVIARLLRLLDTL